MAPGRAARGVVKVRVRCYAELAHGGAAGPAAGASEISLHLDRPARARDLLDRLGLDAEEVELILVGGASRGLDYPLHDGDRVALYPVFESFDVAPLLRLRSEPLRDVRFLADAHLGRLARYLRLLGFDTRYENDPGDAALVRISRVEGRILLSRDRALLARPQLTHALWIPPVRPREQVAYVVERLDLYARLRPFTRCTLCNGTLEAVDARQIEDRVPPRVLAAFDRFWRCTGCGRIYWQGSHYERLQRLVQEIAAGRRGARPAVEDNLDPSGG